MSAGGCGVDGTSDPDLDEDRDASDDDLGDDGNPVYAGLCLIERTRISDGFVMQREYRNYVDGKLYSQEIDTAVGGNAADGTIDSRVQWGYDDSGRLLDKEFDDGVDGVIDRVERWERDEATGIDLSFEVDVDADGTFESIYRMIRDADTGQLINRQWEHYESGSMHDEAFLYYQDGPWAGSLRAREMDRLGDGSVERVWTFDYEDGGNGNPRLKFHDYDQDGYSILNSSTSWPEPGATPDGVVDVASEYRYDDQGRRVELRFNEQPNQSPQIDVLERYFYECE